MAPEKSERPETVSADKEAEPEVREVVLREASPETAPALVILQVFEETDTFLPSEPRVTLPEAVRLPPVEMPEEKSPNEAETPEPVWGGEEEVGPGTEVVRKITGFWT